MSTRGLIPLLTAAALICSALPPVMAQTPPAQSAMIEDFKMQPETRWRFFTDQVMGGVSTGGADFATEDGHAFARMTGRVSTANRGGFIQMRLDLASPPPEGTTGVRLIVRGNDQRYFVHLRTGGTLLPWQYYQAGFDVPQGWAEVRLPLSKPPRGEAGKCPPNRGQSRLGCDARGRTDGRKAPRASQTTR